MEEKNDACACVVPSIAVHRTAAQRSPGRPAQPSSARPAQPAQPPPATGQAESVVIYGADGLGSAN